MGPELPGAPFSMSPDAALWVVEQLRAAEARPQRSGMVPALCYAWNKTAWDEKRGILEQIPYPYLFVGWYRPEQLGGDEGKWIDILDRKVFLYDTTLKELRGKHLRLHTVKSALRSQVLRAGAEEKGIFKFVDD
jgi:hypothetical protein